jgi:outer membrane immunogenic protein
MKKLVIASAVAGLIGTPALAADMAVPGPAYYPKSFPPPAIYDWSGIYIGGHIGGGMLTDSVSQNGVASSTFNLANSGDLRPAGVIGGAQLGANYEFVPWVIGVEGSWTDSAISGSTLIPCSACMVAVPNPLPPPAPATLPMPIINERFNSQALWFAAVTGRVGYAANDWLFYAKAGGAWMRARYTEDLLGGGLSATKTPPGTTVATQVITDDRTGFTVGAGIEFGLVENLSAKVEYDFYDFGTKNYNFAAITPVSVRSDVHALTVGLNYKFNWSGGPKP